MYFFLNLVNVGEAYYRSILKAKKERKKEKKKEKEKESLNNLPRAEPKPLWIKI